MSARRIGAITFFIVMAYLIQVSAVEPIDFLLYGPDLLLLVLFAWILQLPRLDGVMVAFGTGLLVDLAPPVDGPLGKWALIYTLAALALAPVVRNADTPLITVGIIAAASAGTVALGYLVSSILGERSWDSRVLLATVIGVGVWNFIFAPAVLMLVRRAVRGTIAIEVLR